MILDRGDRVVRRAVGPDGIDRAVTAGGQAVIAGLALVRAPGGVVAGRQKLGIDIGQGNILHRRIGRFLQCQSATRVSDRVPGELDDDMALCRRDGDRMVGTGDPGLTVGHVRLLWWMAHRWA